MPWGSLSGDIQFKLLSGFCYPQTPSPRAGCRSPHYWHPWVLLSRQGTAPTLPIPEAESQRSHYEITLCSLMYLGHGRPSYVTHRRAAALLPATSPPSQKNELGLAARKPSTHQWGGTWKGLFAWSQAVGTSCPQGRECPGSATALPQRHAWPGKSFGLCLPAEAAAQFHLHCLYLTAEKLVQTPVHANLGIFSA